MGKSRGKNNKADDEQLPGQMSILDLIEEEPHLLQDTITDLSLSNVCLSCLVQ